MDRILASSYEKPITTSISPLFEDSIMLAWSDESAGIFGFFRSATRSSVGEYSVHFEIKAGQELFTNAPSRVAGASDDWCSNSNGDEAAFYDVNKQQLSISQPDCHGVLHFSDFHPRFDYFAAAGLPLLSSLDSGHFMIGGLLTGELVIRGKVHSIKALAFRDHAWGIAKWDGIAEVRWWQMVFGPDLVYSLATLKLASGQYSSFGYAVIDGVTEIIRDSNILNENSEDIFSVNIKINSLEKNQIWLQHNPQHSFDIVLKGLRGCQSLGIVKCGNRRGMSLVEMIFLR